MGMHTIKEKFSIYKGNKHAEGKFRKNLSSQIIQKFGKGPFEQAVVREILYYSINYYISEFSKKCQSESSYTIYKFIFWLHEQATELNSNYPHENFSPTISAEYIALYRRILKFIIEMGCDIKMVSGEKIDKKFKSKAEDFLDDLLFLGEMILTCVNLYAEQAMIEDVAEILFNENDLYIFTRRHHYDFIFKHINKELSSHLKEAIIDENGHADFELSLEKCFGIKYENVGQLIGSLHKHFKIKPGEALPVNWEGLTHNLHGDYEVALENADLFFRGLRLDSTNKMSLLDLACKPYNLNRFLYRPVVMWNVDGKDFAVLGCHSWDESIHQYVTNAIPWGKAPKEWIKIDCFKEYVHRKEDEHDKWLDDVVEEIVIKLGLLYDRNVEQLNSDNGKVSLLIKDLGEIDFIILSIKMKKIFISDCKHLHGRYDVVNQKNDFNAFTSGSKSYNTSMLKKLKWLEGNRNLLEEHFKNKYPNDIIKLDDYITEGIFIVNTPTLYMYNSQYRIYTIKEIEKVLSGEFVDPTFAVLIDEEDQETILHVKYPYFRKPTYISFDPFEDSE